MQVLNVSNQFHPLYTIPVTASSSTSPGSGRLSAESTSAVTGTVGIAAVADIKEVMLPVIKARVLGPGGHSVVSVRVAYSWTQELKSVTKLGDVGEEVQFYIKLQ